MQRIAIISVLTYGCFVGPSLARKDFLRPPSSQVPVFSEPVSVPGGVWFYETASLGSKVVQCNLVAPLSKDGAKEDRILKIGILSKGTLSFIIEDEYLTLPLSPPFSRQPLAARF